MESRIHDIRKNKTEFGENKTDFIRGLNVYFFVELKKIDIKLYVDFMISVIVLFYTTTLI